MDGDGDMDVLSAGDSGIAWHENANRIAVDPISGLTTTEAGGAAVFTVALGREPTADVTIELSSSDATEGTVAPTSLIYTAWNWMSPQEVTVTGIYDDINDGDISYTIITAAAISEDPFYAGLNIADVSVTNVDVGPADFGDAPSPYPTLGVDDGPHHLASGPRLGINRDTEHNGSPSLDADADDNTGPLDDEDGVDFDRIVMVGQLDATVRINVQNAPQGAKLDVWIDFNADGSWGGPFERIANALDVFEGNNAIRFDVPSWAAQGVTYARFRLSSSGDLAPTGGATDGEVEDFQVLITRPRPANCEFTPHTLATTARGLNSVFAADIDGDGDMDALSAAQTSVDWYENDGTPDFACHTIATGHARSVFAADVDGDSDLDVVAAFSYGLIAWYENDGSGSFLAHTITTSAYGVNSVFVADMDGDGDMDVLSPFQGSTDWYENDGTENFTPRTVTTWAFSSESIFPADVDSDGDMDVVLANGNTIAWGENNGDESFEIRIIGFANTPTAYVDSLFAADLDSDGDVDVLSADGTDDRIAWFENDGIEGFTTHTITASADGASSVFAADMDGDGDWDVISASSMDHTIAWYENEGEGVSTPRIITDSASFARSIFLADMDGDGDLDVLSASRAVGATISWYENLHDPAGISITPNLGHMTTETGGEATLTVVLESEPIADVRIRVTSSDTTEGIVPAFPLMFTSQNWSTPQTVTVTGENDDVDDGDIGYTIVVGPVTSFDTNYSSIDPADVSVTNTDNDTAGVTVTPVSGLVTTEAGGADQFTVVLDTQPIADVTIALSSSDTTEGTVAPAALTFTAANWNTAQTVTVTGVNDDVDDDDIVYTITVGPVTGSDAKYIPVDPTDVTVTNTDDDDTSATVVGRHIFYNNSAWDGNGAGPNANDDNAIAPPPSLIDPGEPGKELGKQALLPGETATFVNYTSYSKGINGVMVDINGLVATPTNADFQFKVGNDNNPTGWATAPAPQPVTVRAGAGVGGSDRVTVIWAEPGAIAVQWLQVTVLANDNTGLAADDVFYFGNAVGESGNSLANAAVDATDEIGARNHPHWFMDPAPIYDAYDYNRDKKVDATDQIIARNNQTFFLNDLNLIAMPLPPAAGGPVSSATVQVAMHLASSGSRIQQTANSQVAVPTIPSATYDAVFEEGVATESESPTVASFEALWLYDFEPTQESKRDDSVKKAVDQLFADDLLYRLRCPTDDGHGATKFIPRGRGVGSRIGWG